MVGPQPSHSPWPDLDDPGVEFMTSFAHSIHDPILKLYCIGALQDAVCEYVCVCERIVCVYARLYVPGAVGGRGANPSIISLEGFREPVTFY